MSNGREFDGRVKLLLTRGMKPLIHRIVLTEGKDNVDLELITKFYVDSLYFRGESSKIQPRSQFTIEPRFALGKPKFIRALAPLAKAKIQRYGIQQIVAPGYGGVSALMCFLMMEKDLNWSILRLEQPKETRILTVLDGFIDRNVPVWITDDLLSSGNAALKTIEILREQKYLVAGFIPIVADLVGNTGSRAFQIFHATMSFTFDFLVGLEAADSNVERLAPFDRCNKAIHD